jgi:hypothetical protein
VQVTPHRSTGTDDVSCPTLAIDHDEEGHTMRFDEEGFDGFVSAASR